MKRLLVGCVALCLATVGAAGAEGIAEITVTGSAAEAKVELASGVSADLTVSFEQVVGLHAGGGSLGLSAAAIDPTDLALLARLPDVQLMGIPAAFPVLIAVEPPASGPLSFSGVVKIELHTHDLEYTVNSPLRLFAADAGGPFRDITNTMGMGSYRVGGSKGGFSEFLIVTDLRAATAVIDGKFDRIQAVLDDNCTEIGSQELATLQAHLDGAWSWYASGNLLAAIDELDSFVAAVKAGSGQAIPSTWRSGGGLKNVAGELREGAGTLRFSLSLAASS